MSFNYHYFPKEKELANILRGNRKKDNYYTNVKFPHQLKPDLPPLTDNNVQNRCTSVCLRLTERCNQGSYV